MNDNIEFDYDLALETIDYSFPNYSPSSDSLEFFALMRIVNGGDFEVNTPMCHYFMIDVIFGHVTDPKQFPYSPEVVKHLDINLDRLGIIASRGLAKSTVVTAFLPVYCAIKGEIPNRGKIYFNLILAASTQSGARVIAKSIKALCDESRFCNEYFEEMRFTETECEFVRKGDTKRAGRTFLVRLQGVGTAIRGVRDHAGRRPCHTRGTIVTTEYGTYPVEQHPGPKQEGNWEIGSNVKVWGLTDTETVSDDHKYWARICTKSKVSKGTRKLYPYAKPNTTYAPSWVEASKLTTDHYIGSSIDSSVTDVQPIQFNKTSIVGRGTDGTIVNAEQVHKINSQTEIMLRQDVSSILGISGIDNQEKLRIPHVFISDSCLWRQVKSVTPTSDNVELIPITCNNTTLSEVCGTPRAYSTLFGISKNCFISFDDVIADTAAAYSETQMHNLEDAMLSDATNALKANGGFTISIATPFHRGDPVCKPIINRSVTPVLLPVCSYIDDSTKEEEFNGAWPEMHPYKSVMSQYINAKKNSKLSAFNLERMLQMSNEEDRMVTDDMIQWYDRNLITKMIDGYSLYMTTDFTTTSAAKSDFSGISLWGVSSNNDYFLLDLCLRRQELQQQYDEVFRMISQWGKYKHIEVGVEIDGQQKAHLFSLKQLMQKKGLYFSFARQKGAPVSREGILSKVGASSKHERFRYILPMFQNKKIYFPEQLKDTPEMKEAMKQLKGATLAGFSAKDDFNDTVSQLGMIDIIPGSGVMKEEEFNDVNSGIWGSFEEDESSNNSTIF